MINIKTNAELINGASCTLEKIQYLWQTTNWKPSILWVFFEDPRIESQWKQRYKRFYTTEIDRTWVPLFVVNCFFVVLNGKVARTQFPLKPAGASTIHAGQGSTFKQVYIDMDISDSAGFQKYPNLAKLYL